MTENPLVKLQPHQVRLDNPAVRAYTIAWLSGERAILRLSLAVGSVSGDTAEVVSELQRKRTALDTAIRMLEESIERG